MWEAAKKKGIGKKAKKTTLQGEKGSAKN